jgi:hypothetical protein
MLPTFSSLIGLNTFTGYIDGLERTVVKSKIYIHDPRILVIMF